MSNNVLDLKLQSLITACKASGNFKKLSVVGFVLTSNIVDEISIKLGMRPRRKKEQEKLCDYLSVVNEIFEKNLQIIIFQTKLIESLREVELLFLKCRGDLPYEYIKQLITIYYELRKFEVPNLYKGMVGEDLFNHSSMGTLSYFSRDSKSRKRNEENKFKPILEHTISQKEKQVQTKLNRKLTQTDLEMAIHLRKMKNSLDNKRKNKISLSGSLKDNLTYEQSQNKLLGYFLLGVALLSILFGIILIIEMFLLPSTMAALNNILLLSFGFGFLVIIIYHKYLNKGRLS
ncbi:MAG: hypothetical protein ACXAAH_03560 [Promethearchaeota archaeon]|jgi:hypothetical protein